MIKLGISSLSLGGVSQILSGISTVSRNYTANTGTEVYDLTPHGVAPFSIPATTGYSLTSPNITVDTATVVGPVTVTDANGDQFIFDASGLTTASVSVTAQVATVIVGDDTDPSKTISATITGGVYDAEVADWTGAQIAALSAGEGVPELAPTTQLTTDANTDGILDEGDVLAVDRDALYLYGELTAPTISHNVLDASNVVLGAAPYTVTAANIAAANGPYKIRATDGTNTIDSATVAIAPPASTVSDDFNRADERLTDSADWSQLSAVANFLEISSNVVQATSAGSNETVEFGTASGSNDQYVEVETTISTGANTSLVRVIGCITDANNYYYAEIAGGGRFRLTKFVGGSSTHFSTQTGITLVAGAKLRLEVEDVGGNQTIRGFYNGTELHSVVDSGLSVTQRSGFRLVLGSGEAVTACQADNFDTGTL